MDSKNVRHTTFKEVGKKASEWLDKLQQQKKDNLDKLSGKMDYYFGTK